MNIFICLKNFFHTIFLFFFSKRLVSHNEHFDHCYIGCGHEVDDGEAFSGQMAAIYVLSQSITPQQAACLHYLGSSYQSHFKHKTESNLPENYKKVIV